MPCRLFVAFEILIVSHSRIILQSLRGHEGLCLHTVDSRPGAEADCELWAYEGARADDLPQAVTHIL